MSRRTAFVFAVLAFMGAGTPSPLGKVSAALSFLLFAYVTYVTVLNRGYDWPFALVLAGLCVFFLLGFVIAYCLPDRHVPPVRGWLIAAVRVVGTVILVIYCLLHVALLLSFRTDDGLTDAALAYLAWLVHMIGIFRIIQGANRYAESQSYARSTMFWGSVLALVVWVPFILHWGLHGKGSQPDLWGFLIFSAFPLCVIAGLLVFRIKDGRTSPILKG